MCSLKGKLILSAFSAWEGPWCRRSQIQAPGWCFLATFRDSFCGQSLPVSVDNTELIGSNVSYYIMFTVGQEWEASGMGGRVATVLPGALCLTLVTLLRPHSFSPSHIHSKLCCTPKCFCVTQMWPWTMTIHLACLDRKGCVYVWLYKLLVFAWLKCRQSENHKPALWNQCGKYKSGASRKLYKMRLGSFRHM